MNDSEQILIDKSEYQHLIENTKLLACLQAAGVDNWSGYEEAQTMMETLNDE